MASGGINPISAITGAVGEGFKAVGSIFTAKQNRKAMESDAAARKRQAEAQEVMAQQQVYLQGRVNAGANVQGFWNTKSLREQAKIAKIKSGQNTILGLSIIIVLSMFFYVIYKHYQK